MEQYCQTMKLKTFINKKKKSLCYIKTNLPITSTSQEFLLTHTVKTDLMIIHYGLNLFIS